MAADQALYAEEHWTAKGGVMAVAIAAGFLPIFGLMVVVPCLVSARRAGVTLKPYVLALAISAVWIAVLALSFLAQSAIEPQPA